MVLTRVLGGTLPIVCVHGYTSPDQVWISLFLQPCIGPLNLHTRFHAHHP